jgi:AraC family transcriptional regulator
LNGPTKSVLARCRANPAVQRRVERAKTLLSESNLPISQIALETGFAHQSHLAHHMRRVLGISPKAVRELHR